jgi:hypothetical protein
MEKHAKRTSVLRAVALAAALAPSAFGAVISFGPMTVAPTDTTSGPSFSVLGGVQAGDTIVIDTSGIMYLQLQNTYGTNAAGIVVVAGTSGVGQATMNPGPGYGTGTNYGVLLLGNTSAGFFQVYPSDAAHGLGSPAPPQSLHIILDLNTFGGGVLIGATTLEFLLSDTIITDNSGFYTVSGVPEPSSAAQAVFALLVSAGLLRRRRA